MATSSLFILLTIRLFPVLLTIRLVPRPRLVHLVLQRRGRAPAPPEPVPEHLQSLGFAVGLCRGRRVLCAEPVPAHFPSLGFAVGPSSEE